MTAARTGRWRRLAVRLVQYAAWFLPGAQSPWGDAMRRELDYITGDPAALRWALGCVLASCKARWTDRSWFSTRLAWRYAATSGVLTLLIGVALQENASGQTGPLRPQFDETACDVPNVSPDIQPRLHCGTVSVPRNYDNPAAGRFKLAVVIAKSEQQPALPEPVVYINGGPGSPLTIYAGYQARNPYAEGRDLILVDQRGIGRSEPGLCPDLGSKLLEADLAVAQSPSEAARSSRRAVYLACRDEAIDHGLDLRDFGTTVTVEDFEWVRRALGIARWNVYGESYGTTVAMTLVARHPDTVRAAVLDSLYPPDPIFRRSSKVAEARDAFFASCGRDDACAAAFPNLAGIYRETLDRLGPHPLTVAVPPSMHRPDDQVLLTASLFEVLVGRLIYYPTAYPSLPRLIAAVHDGDTKGLAAIFASELMQARELNRAAEVAVECRDRPGYRHPPAEGANPPDQVDSYGICDDWSELGPAPVIPIDTAVPILVLAGQFDPVAGPSLSREVTGRMGGNARWIEFPLIGHNVRHFSPCGAKIAADFIDNPPQALDTSCADRVAPIHFLTRQQTP